MVKEKLENNIAEILTVIVFVLVMTLTGCGTSSYYVCDAYASVECENCDEID